MNIPQWSGPGVECYGCGRHLTPIAHRASLVVPWFWFIPPHSAFVEVTLPCGGSGKAIGPVAVST